MASAEKILFDLDPQYDDQLLPFCVSERRVKEVCDYRRFENSDLMNLKIAVAGFGALIEVANLVMGAQDQRKGMPHSELFGSCLKFDIQVFKTTMQR